jgi:uncharacterized membrane protein
MKNFLSSLLFLVVILLLILSDFNTIKAQRLYWLKNLTANSTSSANAVSNDGMFVVGILDDKAVIWNRNLDTVLVVLDNSSAFSSCDSSGMIAVGLSNPGYYSFQTPFMWSSQSGFQWLPPTPEFGWVADITPSGSIAVGKAKSPVSSNRLPAIWNLSFNPPVYQTYSVGNNMDNGEAYGVSDDGRTIVCFGHGSGWGYRGVVFNLNTDFTLNWWYYLLPDSGHFGCVPRDISENGNIAVGNSGNLWGGSYYPVMWRLENNWKPELLANLGGNAGEANDIRGDVIIGFSTTSDNQRYAVRWRLNIATTQVEDLNQTYSSLLTDGSKLITANGLSSNGRFIVGQGYNASTNRNQAYLLDTQIETKVSEQKAGAKFQINLLSQPVREQAQININVPDGNHIATLEIYDILGRIVMVPFKDIMLSRGKTSLSFNVKNLSSGLYLMVLKSNNLHSVLPMVVVR